MQKNIYRLFLVTVLIVTQNSLLQTREELTNIRLITPEDFDLDSSNQSYIDQDIERNKNNSVIQHAFIADNGTVGIFQPSKHKAFIGDDQYDKVRAILIKNSDKKNKKPRNKVRLGNLIDGDNRFILYGRNSNPPPVNNNPDADVRTEEKLGEDFGRNFGSGQYTPNDKWD